jgi:tRNA threonylcarbamoyladenosine biosynthesis protein TsaE
VSKSVQVGHVRLLMMIVPMSASSAVPGALVFEAASESETDRLAAAVAEVLVAGDVLRLSGPLGAGKTRFVQGLAAALGCRDALVNSPTFVLVQEYEGRLPIYHLDAYRLRDGEEFSDLGGEELLEAGGVTCLEWAERVADRLPRGGLTIRIEATGPAQRRFELIAGDSSWEQRLPAVAQRLREQ